MRDLVQPFQLDIPNLRGRLVRLPNVAESIISRHNYPAPVAKLLAEAIALATLLAGMLKYEGIFTLQAKGDGVVKTLVADVTSQGAVRAYAQFAADKITPLMSQATAKELMGQGYIAFTVDQAAVTDRYQGMVTLEGDTLTEFIQHYFKQSEQIDTGFVLSSQMTEAGWLVAGMMLQRLPNKSAPVGADADLEDGWRRCMLLMSTLSDHEMLNPYLHEDDLLFRVFHEEEVRVFESKELRDECRCSQDRVRNALKTLTAEDVTELTMDGKKIEVTCEFCARLYQFAAHDL